MKRLEEGRRTSMIRTYLNGYEPSEVARSLRENVSSVTREIERLESREAEVGIEQAAGEYKVTSEVTELHEIAVVKRQNDVDNVQMIQGVRIARLINQLGIDEQQLQTHLSDVYKWSKSKSYTPSNLISDCQKIAGLESKFGSFETIKKDWESVGSDLPKKRKELETVKTELDSTRKELKGIHEQYDTTKEELEQFKAKKAELRANGLDLDDLEAASYVLKGFEREKNDPKRILSQIQSIGNLEQEEQKLSKAVGDDEATLVRLEKQTKEVETNLTAKKGTLEEATKLEETGISLDQVKKLRGTIVRVSANHAIDPSEAMTRFENGVLRNYDAQLGLEPRVKGLEKKVEEAEGRLQELDAEFKKKQEENKDKLQLLERHYAHEMKEIEAYQRIRERGVKEGSILAWEETIAKCGLTPSEVHSSLAKYRRLKDKEEAMRNKISRLESTALSLESKVMTLSGKKEELESSISAMKTVCEKELESLKRAAITAVKEEASKAEKDVTGTLEIAKTAANQFTASITNTTSSIEGLLGKAIDTGKKIGELGAIRGAYEFITLGTGEPSLVMPLAKKFLTNLAKWYRTSDKIVEAMNIDSTITRLQL